MKKIILVLIALALMLALPITTFAENVAIEEDIVVDEVIDEVVDEVTPPTDGDAEATPDTDIIEGLNNETLDKIIALGQALQELKESEYTFKERMLQLINPENLSGTLGTVATVVVSIAVFIFRSIMKRDTENNMGEIAVVGDDVLNLGKTVKKLTEKNKELEATVEKLVEVIESNTIKLEQINVDTTENKLISDTAKAATIATAKMVSDAFSHSRTIDAATKALITYDYLEVLKSQEAKKQTSEEV